MSYIFDITFFKLFRWFLTHSCIWLSLFYIFDNYFSFYLSARSSSASSTMVIMISSCGLIWKEAVPCEKSSSGLICVMGSFSWQMWPIFKQHQADSVKRWSFAAPGFSYGWSWVLLWLEIELMSWLSYQTQPTYFAMRIHPVFSDTLWLIEPFLSAKVGETKKINHVIELNISYMQWKDHTDRIHDCAICIDLVS